MVIYSKTIKITFQVTGEGGTEERRNGGTEERRRDRDGHRLVHIECRIVADGGKEGERIETNRPRRRREEGRRNGGMEEGGEGSRRTPTER